MQYFEVSEKDSRWRQPSGEDFLETGKGKVTGKDDQENAAPTDHLPIEAITEEGTAFRPRLPRERP